MIDKLIVTNEENKEKEITIENYKTYDKYFRFTTAIHWNFEEVEFRCEKVRNYFPFFDKGLLAIQFHEDDINYPHPNNLVILNADKSVHEIITVPLFINEQTLKERITPKGELGKFEVLESLELVDNKEHLIVLISTQTHHTHWGLSPLIEKRALNTETWEWHPKWSVGGVYWG